MVGKDAPRQVVWTSLEPPGIEYCSISERGSGWTLAGSLVRQAGKRVGVLSYTIETDSEWRTRGVIVEEVTAGKRFVLEMRPKGTRWLIGGKQAPALDGATDVDLEASPVTNTLSIKRSGIRVGEKVDLIAAWVRSPSLKVEPLGQSYERLSKDRYRFSSTSGFNCVIEVDEFGMVRKYGKYWRAV